MEKFDFAIIGAGIVGLAVGIEILKKAPDARVAIFEKESAAGLHASGRNSGVVHAGFYYSPDSLKAQLTRDGNALLKEFALENGVFLRETGKVVVAQSDSEIPLIHELKRRGDANGVNVEIVDERDLARLEPRALTHQVALWSPSTAVGDPKDMTKAFVAKFEALGGLIFFNTKIERVLENQISGPSGSFAYRHLVNAAGLYADKVGRQLGFSKRYSMLPFIGLYHYAPKLKGSLSRHIYPVPDPRNPFLGVHLTTTVDGSVKVGPTAIPILSREQYSTFEGFSMAELAGILGVYPKFMLSPHHDVWGLLKTELPKLSRNHLVKQAGFLADGFIPSDFTVRGKPGIRAQLFDLVDRKLEMDFVIDGDEHSTHILNAVSPAWTSSISFARHVVGNMSDRKVF